MTNDVRDNVQITVASATDETSVFDVKTAVGHEVDNKRKTEKRIKRKAGIAKVLGLCATVFTAARLVLCPLLVAIALAIDFFGFFFVMMGGGLVLAMSSIVLPFLPLLVILLGVVLIVALFALDLLPIALGVVAFKLAKSAKMSAEIYVPQSFVCRKAVAKAKKATLWGFILPLTAEPVVIVPTILFSLPIVFLIVIAAIFFLQLLGIMVTA